MPSPNFRLRDEENVNNVPKATANTATRRVLGDVSPNVPNASSTPAFLKKPLSGSPLKRSFTAAMESGEGLKYLKMRKLAEDEVLSETVSMDSTEERKLLQHFQDVGSPPRLVLDAMEAEADVEDRCNTPAIQVPTPTELNTPSDENEDTQTSSNERNSFSSLINYDPSSQPSHFASVSNAQMLKLRLRVAMFKVRTNQVNVPFSELQVERRARMPFTHHTIEEAIAQLKWEAQEVATRRVSAVPKLLPAPLLAPTTYSARMIYETRLPSSPPVSGSPEQLPVAPYLSTPQRDVRKISSPVGSGERVSRLMSEQELTSSVVKGRAAADLLGLRNAA